MFNKKIIMTVIWTIVMLIIVAFFPRSSADQVMQCAYSDSAKAPVLTKLKIGYIPIAECAHLYVGMAKNYFEQEGLEVLFQPMKGGAVILPALQTGDLDIGFTNVVSIIILNAKMPSRAPKSFISLVGATYERRGFTNHALLKKRNSSLSIKDLGNPNIKFALNTTRNIEELMLRRFLVKKGIKITRLNIIQLGFPEMLSALDRGDIDVVSEVEPFIEPALHTQKYVLLARQYQEVSPNTLVATYAVTRKWLKKNRDVADRFIRAFRKADDFIKNNEPEMRQIVGSFTRISKENLSIIGMPAFEAKESKNDINELISEMYKYGFIDRKPNPDDLIIE
ncbi:MAG: ABC transporter substrate-binding protein [bacterium]